MWGVGCCAWYVRTSCFVEVVGHPWFSAQFEVSGLRVVHLTHCCFTATSCFHTSTNTAGALALSIASLWKILTFLIV